MFHQAIKVLKGFTELVDFNILLCFLQYLKKILCNTVFPIKVHTKTICRVLKEAISNIKQIVGSNYIYSVGEETTDSCGRYIAHLLIGILTGEQSNRAYVISFREHLI